MPGLVIYRFGPFEFDPVSRRLSCGAEAIRLLQSSAAVLVCLLEHPGEVVSKETLIASHWRDAAISDNSLDQALSRLRRAFDDLAGTGDYIERLPLRGYRLRVPVQRDHARVAEGDVEAMLAPHRALVNGRARLDTLDLPTVRQALEDYLAILHEMPDDPEVHTDIAEARALIFEHSTMDLVPDMASLESGLKHAHIACKLAPNAAGPFSVLAHLEVLRGRTDAAMAAARKAQGIEPDNPRHGLRVARAGWGGVRLQAGRHVLTLLPSLAIAHWLCATVYIARQVPDAITEVLLGMAAQDAQTPGAKFGMVGLHLLHGLLMGKEGRLIEAIAAIHRELATVKHSTLVFARECLSNCFYTLGAFHWRLGEHDQFRSYMSQALIVAPGHVAARAALHGEVLTSAGAMNAAMAQGIVLKRGGREAEAAHVLHEALRTAPAGAAMWISPVEPMLNAAGRPEVWAELMALVRVRAT